MTLLNVWQTCQQNPKHVLKGRTQTLDLTMGDDTQDETSDVKRNFMQLLKDTSEITESSTYDQASSVLKNNRLWFETDVRTRRRCFQHFTEQLWIENQTTPRSSIGSELPTGWRGHSEGIIEILDFKHGCKKGELVKVIGERSHYWRYNQIDAPNL